MLRKLFNIWLAWTVAGVFFATQDFMTRLYRGESIRWLSILAGWMAAMYVCAVLTPAVLWLGRRWALERGHLVSHVLIHVICSVAFSLIANTLEAPLLLAMKVIPATEAYSLGSAISLLLAYGFHGGVIRYWAVLIIQTMLKAHEEAKERESEAQRLTIRSTMLAQQLTAAQLNALKMQLQPHFLFNTLNAIMVLTEQNKGPEAVQTLARFSDLLRLTLEDVAVHEVTLQRELDFLQLYLSIEQTRFKDRLKVKIEAEPMTADALVPHMVLQPLVENAIRHGLARSESCVLIDIGAYKQGDTLMMTVSDDGPGSAEPLIGGKGIGLANTRDRLRHLYGSRGVLHAENRLPQGVQVTVTIPFHTETLEVVNATEDSGR
ncbi:MAG TPA: histidine kinase [Steroidobacteraceae bacterium]|nr:histidine kinase [Steroidobacteraceae bacterium]